MSLGDRWWNETRISVFFGLFTNCNQNDLDFLAFTTRNGQLKVVYKRTIEIPQRTYILKVNFCLEAHNAPLNLVLPLSG